MSRSRKQKTQKTLHQVQPDSAGIDIGANEIFIAVPEDRSPEPVRCFSTFTDDLHTASKWLKSCGIKSIAMESTGVYWIPIYQILEDYDFEVLLVNARHVKNVPGRKTDVQDCQWLQYLHSVGLLNGSFRPSNEICMIRTLLRHRRNMVITAGSHVQHMQKSLTQMNLQIHNVISDITGVTGLAIVDAILSGEHNSEKLSELRDKRIKADQKTIARSLMGDYRTEHLFTLKQALQSYRHYQQMISDCDAEIENLLNDFDSSIDPEEKPLLPSRKKKKGSNELNFDLRPHMNRILGTDLTEIDGVSTSTVSVVFSEVGTDISKFPTCNQFCSWLGLSPNNKISGGKILSSKTNKVKNRLAHALRLSAQSLWNNQSYLGHYYRRMRSKLGAPKAITATAHKLARIIYHMMTNQCHYDETIFYEQENLNKQRMVNKLRYQAKYLGLKLIPVDFTGEVT